MTFFLRMLNTYFLWIFIIFIILKTSALPLSDDSNYSYVDVYTNCGLVRGVRSGSEDGAVFRGIPYASPPVGNLRWRPPVPLKRENKNCWTGIIQTDSFGSQCVQLKDEKKLEIDGNEDCLFLNVWTPCLSAESTLPVLFWIHGGYLLSGNGNQQDIGYAPSSRLAEELNVVFVSINYRLHAFGFMALKILENNSPTKTSGNYGLMDMIAALEWVQENIRNFGGDPNQVTVVGQSSGGSAILALLASKLSKRLFQKAWLMSASPILNKTAAEAYADNTVFIRNTGCGEDIECLLSLPADVVTASVPWHEYPYWAMDDLLEIPEKNHFDGALLIVDGYVLKESPVEAWNNGNGLDVPILIGTTAQETDIGTSPKELEKWTWHTSDYQRHVLGKLEPFGRFIALAALMLYPPYVSTPEHQLSTMVTDIRATCGTNYIASVLAATFTSPVYRYVAAYIPPKPFPLLDTGKEMCCAFHAIDALAFFGNLHKLRTKPIEQDLNFQHNIQREVLTFVRSSQPFSKQWTRYPFSTSLVEEQTQIIHGKSYHEEECLFWSEVEFLSYSWIN